MSLAKRISIYILFLSIIIFPYNYYSIKIPLLLIFLIGGVTKIIKTQKIDLNLTIFSLFNIYIVAGFFYIFYGYLMMNAHEESYFYTIALYIIFPFIYFILLTRIDKNETTIIFAEKLLKYGLIGVSTVIFLSYLNKKYIFPEYLDFLFNNINVDNRTDVVRIRYNGISSILFLFPFYFTKIIISKRLKTTKEFFGNIAIILYAFSAIFLTGRKALIILFFFSIILAFAFKLLLNIKIIVSRKIIMYLFTLFIASLPILFIFNFDKQIKSFYSTFTYALDFSKTINKKEVESERANQTVSFANYIIKKPILGYGHGAVMDDMIRSKETPWRYEITYLDIVFHTGFLGLLIYSLGPIWIFMSLYFIVKIRDKYIDSAFGLINALACVFIASFTNPYLNAFDIQWVIYYPILFIIIVNRKRANNDIT